MNTVVWRAASSRSDHRRPPFASWPVQLLVAIFCLVVALLLAPSPLFARELRIEHFDAQIAVLPDSSINVTETITVHFIGRASPLVIHLEGAVVWRTEQGIGMEYTRTDPRSFSRLKNILAYNYKAPEEFSDEFRHSATILERQDS